MGNAVSFAILGPVEAQADGRTIDLGRPRARAVLAYLLTSGNRVVSTERLIDAVWDGAAPPTARAQIHADISALRRGFATSGAAGLIATLPPGYLLRLAEGQLDWDAFRHEVRLARQMAAAGCLDDAATLLRRALGRWRGPSMAGAAAAYIDRTRAAIEERRLSAYEQLVDLELALGRHQDLIAELTELWETNPTRESLAGRLMLASYRCGRPSDALRIARRLRRSLVDREGLDPSRSIAELERSILRADPRLDWTSPAAARDGRPAGHGSGGAAVLVPAYDGPRPIAASVPPAASLSGPGELFGRAKALQWLDQQLSQPVFGGIAILTGGPGVGKSALALHWARTRAESFPGGRLAVDLDGGSAGQPVHPLDALAALLRALGVAPQRLPDLLDDRCHMFRDLVARRRVLIVLDGATTAEQVRPLLPGRAGCMTVITSRAPLGDLVVNDGAARLGLTLLQPADATAFLAASLGAERVAAEVNAAEQLAAACAGLPLALAIAATNLLQHRYRGIADIVAALRNDAGTSLLDLRGDSGATVRDAFAASHATLPDRTRVLFRRLGLMPGPDFTVAEAATAAGMDPEQAHLHLALLFEAGLVDQHTPGRFSQHDLLRRYAIDHLRRSDPPTEIDRCRRRLYHHYLDAVDRAGDSLYPELLRLPVRAAAPEGPDLAFAEPAEALAWLDAERPNLVALIQAASDHGLGSIAWRVNDALRGYFSIRRDFDDWIRAGETALASADGAADQLAQVACLLSLAHANWWLGQYARAARELRSALAIAEDAGWTEAAAVALGNLGGVLMDSGMPRAALPYLGRAVTAGLGSAQEPVAVTNLAGVSHSLGALVLAAQQYRYAQTRYERHGSAHGVACARLGIGEVTLDLGQRHVAERELTAAYAIFSEYGDALGKSSALTAMARLRRLDSTQTATHYAEQALVLARRGRSGAHEADALCTLASIRRSPDLCLDALRVAHAARASRIVGEALVGLAGILIDLRCPVEGSRRAQEAVRFANEHGFRVTQGKALAELAVVSAAEGRRGPSRRLAEQALRLGRATGHSALSQRAGRLLTRC
jgi:DNA-binding SARP family transcriptional activator